ncbi:unnamed protein product, partial [marine sediment metagenome]
TTSGILSSSLTFNKKATKLFLKPFGILSPASVYLYKGELIKTETIIDKLGLPVFVKPNQSGSSFGVTKADNEATLEKAISHAFEEGDEIIIEEFIEGSEITCGLLKAGSKEIIFPLCEIISKNEFFDYEAKYTPSKAEEIVPARISADKTRECQSLASYIYSAVDCRGIVRIDFILSGDKFYFLEVNTIPGMSAESIIPKMARKYGISLRDEERIPEVVYGMFSDSKYPCNLPSSPGVPWIVISAQSNFSFPVGVLQEKSFLFTGICPVFSSSIIQFVPLIMIL